MRDREQGLADFTLKVVSVTSVRVAVFDLVPTNADERDAFGRITILVKNSTTVGAANGTSPLKALLVVKEQHPAS
jgi:hypothetical protein